MPPRLILHDTVEGVVQRIPEHCRNLLQPQDLASARDALRVLATKVPVGTLGNQDRPENRAVVLLEFAVRSRSSNDGTTLKLKDLCRSVGVKENTLKKLHDAIGHYYHDLYRKPTHKNAAETQLSHPKRKATRSTRESLAQEEPARKQSRRGEMPESVLPSLAIRLASHLADPHGVARRSRILFYEIYAHAMASLPTAEERRGQEHDFRRYWSAYQASVLYHVATTAQDQNPSVSRKDEEVAVRPLRLEDLVKACSDCTYMNLKDKVALVQKWAEEIQPKRAPKSKGGCKVSKKKNTSTASSPKTTKELDAEKSESSFDFVQWKESILAPVLERTKLAAQESNVDHPLDRSSLLTIASDAILAKYGICADGTR